MATFRCLACKAVYIDPQPSGMRYFHACGVQYDRKVFKDHDEIVGSHPYANARDENIVQDEPGGPVRMRSVGAGREKLSDDDLLSGIAPDQVKTLHDRPAIGPSPHPEEDLNKGREDVKPSKPQ